MSLGSWRSFFFVVDVFKLPVQKLTNVLTNKSIFSGFRPRIGATFSTNGSIGTVVISRFVYRQISAGNNCIINNPYDFLTGVDLGSTVYEAGADSTRRPRRPERYRV